MTRVNWILSLMKSGRAATFATHITEKVSAGDVPYTTFKGFEQEFKEKFFPRNERVNALNKLESDTYHQGQRTVEEYTEAFKELVDEAGYPLDNAVTVRRYRKGLNLHIQDSVATQKIPPGEDDLEGWYDAACRFDNSRLVNEAFMSTSGPIVATPSTPERPVTCDHCGKMGHLTAQCSGLQDIESLVEEVVQQSIRQIKKGADTIRHKVKTPTLKPEIGPGYGKKKEGFSKDTALLLCNNRFAPLRMLSKQDECEQNEAVSEHPKPPTPPTTARTRRPKWERRLPRIYAIDTKPGRNSLTLDVELQTTDTQEVRKVRALVDSGATGLFIDSGFVREQKLTTREISQPIPVRNVDGTYNENGAIREVVDLILRYRGHAERAPFAVTSLGSQKVILGYSWLRNHNPEIDWVKGEVKMSRCLQNCATCREEKRKRHRTSKKGDHTSEDKMEDTVERATVDSTEQEEINFAEGDRLFATVIRPVEHIRASTTTSQRLAEAHAKLSQTPGWGFREIVPEHLHKFEDIFNKDAFDTLPEHKRWDHAIELHPGSESKACKVYPVSPNEQSGLDAFIDENLASGRIRPSKSPMASPVFFIKKKDGSLRLIQDYRALNAMTIKNRYPLPLISELINKLRGARYFTKLDIRWGYNNVRIKKGDEWKAAFRTNRGLFEPLVMFFGLTNSPATFQSMMNDIFRDLISDGVVCVYLDDILIFTSTIEEHRRITELVLERLRKHKLYLKPEKCEFEKEKIEYLGLVISRDKVEMDPVKIAGVMDWPAPKNKKEVQSFLGFVNFYRRFIQDFSHHARPLFDTTKKEVPWQWTSKESAAFEKMKALVTSAPVLSLPDDSEPFQVEADSSDYATGAVLSQRSREDGKWHPIAFFSKSLSPVERNYEIHDKEMLAIIRALQEWRHFLEGAKHTFEILTDHKNLQYFMTAKNLNRRQARWSLVLARYDFTLTHRPGRRMGKPDALSRRPDHGLEDGDNQGVTLLKPELFLIRVLEGVQVEGEERDFLKEIRRGNKDGDQEEAVVKAVTEMRKAGERSLRASEWKEEGDLLYFRGKIYVPNLPELRRDLVNRFHDSKVAGHPGRWKTLELLSRHFWWPGISRYVGQYVKSCDLCIRTKIRRTLPVGELHPLPVPEQRWDTISVDFIVELPSSHGFDAVMNVVDSVSKRAHFIPTTTTITAAGAANLFRNHVWKLHGLPKQVVSDRGPQFVGQFTRELYRRLGIKLATTTAYHPQGDGQTERVNQELEQYLRLFVSERQDDWDELLPMAEFHYNNQVHASTQHTPFMLDTGRNPRMGFEPRLPPSKIESVNEFRERMAGSLEEARAALGKAKSDMARYYDQRRAPAPAYKVGDKVYLDASDIRTTRPSRKLAHRYLGPFPITAQVAPNAYRLRLPRSLKRLHPVFNVVKLVQALPDPIPGRKAKPPPPPDLVDGIEEFEVEEILDSRQRRDRLEFLVKWKGYGTEENSWEPASDVYAPAKVAEYYQQHPEAPGEQTDSEVPPAPRPGRRHSNRRRRQGR